MAKQIDVLALADYRPSGPRPDVWAEFDSEEKKEKLGIKDLTVQGQADILDVNKLVVRMTPAQIQELAAKHAAKAQYGVDQSKMSLRDLMLEAQKMKGSFLELPAVVREYFGNDEFSYHEFLAKNKDNKYAISELHAEITGSESFKRQLELQKQRDADEQNAILQKRESEVSILAEVLKKAGVSEPK